MSPYSAGNAKFMGMTKPTFTRLLIGILLATFLFHIYTIRLEYGLAQAGAQAHAVECVYKGTVQKQYDQTKKLISETPAQRYKTLLPQLGPKLAKELSTIPTSVYERGAQQQGTTLQALKGLTCP